MNHSAYPLTRTYLLWDLTPGSKLLKTLIGTPYTYGTRLKAS